MSSKLSIKIIPILAILTGNLLSGCATPEAASIAAGAGATGGSSMAFPAIGGGVLTALQVYNTYSTTCGDQEYEEVVPYAIAISKNFEDVWDTTKMLLASEKTFPKVRAEEGTITTDWITLENPWFFKRLLGVPICDYQMDVTVIRISNGMTKIRLDPYLRVRGLVFVLFLTRNPSTRGEMHLVYNHILNKFWSTLLQKLESPHILYKDLPLKIEKVEDQQFFQPFARR